MEETLKKALKNKEFKLFLQPLIDVKTGDIVGAEALARWNSPSRGFLTPDSFIPAMEHYGLITELDFAMLERVCILLKKWEMVCAPDITIFVNQSRLHLMQEDYVERVSSMLAQYDITPGNVGLELTENSPCDDRARLREVCRELKALGVQLAIDDYGVGYSSLSILKDCNVDVLKIDQSFMILTEQWRDEIILKRTIEMARELGIKTVCEGVESQEQAKLLKKLNCPLAQGYYYAKPMTVTDFERVLPMQRLREVAEG